MELLAFHTLRAGLQVQAAPASPLTLVAMSDQLHAALLGSGVFDHVEVDVSTDTDRLLVGLCAFDGTHAEEDVAAALDSIWQGLRFPHWEAHATILEPGHVEFEASSLRGVSQDFITLHVVAVRCPVVPSQRSGGHPFL